LQARTRKSRAQGAEKGGMEGAQTDVRCCKLAHEAGRYGIGCHIIDRDALALSCTTTTQRWMPGASPVRLKLQLGVGVGSVRVGKSKSSNRLPGGAV
jgi:hypothetical protein